MKVLETVSIFQQTKGCLGWRIKLNTSAMPSVVSRHNLISARTSTLLETAILNRLVRHLPQGGPHAIRVKWQLIRDLNQK
jgi:hypothetical protein